MKLIMENWREFNDPDNSALLKQRLQEALSRRQLLSGGTAGLVLAAIMGSDYFNNLPDSAQEDLIDSSPTEWADLDIKDPEYLKAVADYYDEKGDFLHPKVQRPEFAGMSDEELKVKQFQAVGKLMIAPAELPSARPWRLAPVKQNRDSGYYAFVSEEDIEELSASSPGLDKSIADAERFYTEMPLTSLWRYVFGQQAFFSYTSPEEANEGMLFDTIEIEQTQKNYFTGTEEKIKVRKLPLSWTVANKVLLDRITILDADLEDSELTDERYNQILEKHGVTSAYFKSKKMTSDEVLRNLLDDGGRILRNMQQANPVVGDHSNQDEIYTMKETLEEIC